MKYVLFTGSRLGYESLQILIDSKVNILHAFIEKEHDHEIVKYYEKIIKICVDNNVTYTLNSTSKEVKSILESQDENFDYLMSFGYRRMIPSNILQLPRVASIGTHFSPLPKYRGFAPLNWLLINGEKETAVNLFYLEDKVDHGDIIANERVNIDYTDDINSLFDKCLIKFKDLLGNQIKLLEKNDFQSTPQNHELATYTCARSPEDGEIDWHKSSFENYNLIRSLTHPYPGAFTSYKGEKLSIFKSEEYDEGNYVGRIPGRVIKITKDGVVVLCGTGALLIKDVQLESSSETVNANTVINSVRDSLI